MKKWIIIAVIAFIGLPIFWYLASPLWRNIEVAETIEAPAEMIEVLASGEFNGVDRVHQGQGMAEILDVDGKKVLRFSNFEVTNGPSLWVWLTKDPVASGADVRNGEYLELSPLKGNIGDQNYELPDDFDVNQYSTAIIWCRPFSVLFASANFN